MFEPQHFDLQDNSGFGDPKSWLSGDNGISDSPTHHRTQSSLANSAPGNGNVDRVLYNDLVEMIPLVQSLIPTDIKGRNAAQSIPVRKKKDQIDKNGSNNDDGDAFSIFSSRSLSCEKENEELVALREQVEDLQRKLLEKDELLKSTEISKNQINDVYAELDKFKQQAAEKDSIFKSIQLQLSDAKIKLADKQAALEKTQWEAMTSKQNVEKLQNDIDSMQGEFSSFMLLLNGLTKNKASTQAEDYDITPYHLDHLPYIDYIDEKETKKMEEARQAYVAALAVAKERQDEESLAAAARARSYLQSFLFRSESVEENNLTILQA
ncbi:hypothetical protein COLO4_27496 [Corchorus olitorius]|uniref:Uncharacterized protein n=1 Tax=Corchorus olitorius TaxID=93759 RepID=A0A1R3HR03_9ROSI|nr:hypothetical protein COLO4_27496 [Corchorus olitorius]